jgi:hypothetical protein
LLVVDELQGWLVGMVARARKQDMQRRSRFHKRKKENDRDQALKKKIR